MLMQVWRLLAITALAFIGTHTSAYGDDGRTVKTTVTKGMVIDSDRYGSRLHVYSWKPRKFPTAPPPLSYPDPDEHWTARITPGLFTHGDNASMIAAHLTPLIESAKATLLPYKNSYRDLPIYFYATGGMKELEPAKREKVLSMVRKFLLNDATCPFFFKEDFAHIINDEEEAIFSLAATNFLMGSMMPTHGDSVGNSSVGTLDLGPSTAHVAFFLPPEESEGSYKFQLGGRSGVQWNVYAKTFQQFGVSSARQRHVHGVVDEYMADAAHSSRRMRVENSCFHAGYSENVRCTYGGDGGARRAARRPAALLHEGTTPPHWCAVQAHSRQPPSRHAQPRTALEVPATAAHRLAEPAAGEG
mmetsp:Transcript_6036/g.13869  ORF Transcript_6036/g.13869 Transcript_6036/m.13869 type:complete len:359 (+) Transcript_6036:118-1194(+)